MGFELQQHLLAEELQPFVDPVVAVLATLLNKDLCRRSPAFGTQSQRTLMRSRLSQLHLLLISCLFLAFSSTARADLFGPENYDECIIESMEGVKSDVAARAIAQACMSQFPEETKPEAASSAERKHEFLMSRIGFDIETDGMRESINKIRFVDQPNGVYGGVRFMNGTTFAISRLKVGIKESCGSCHSKLSDYKYIVNCEGLILGQSAETLTCDNFDGNFCVVGFTSAEFFTSRKEIQEHFKKHGVVLP